MSAKRRRVMVIDDAKSIRVTTESFLNELGHEVLCCNDGLNGIGSMVTFNPEILFIDVEMPRMNGLQTTRLIRGNAQFKSTPIVMLSSKDGMFDMALASSAGANDYIVKPPTAESIAAMMTKYLG
ncbi:response regulator [Pseudomonas syringae]|uniref:response regulator n=1 Tax=Pseudomonas syringae TaxID=317 RepID=UPI001F22E31A|nr:response regulator [Pseudomonas syringae]MCF5371342.1 response regulator [Pseudomonas syringae]MCF5382061.1 response regulator [Pseudomonas syringae]MCF5419355.1 response regulator [Pseudomonas syringae]MCF5455035.1 response regulator [Pseudomonas syringae]MCF5460939.1 response regulator [Pseudomonas syringae]